MRGTKSLREPMSQYYKKIKKTTKNLLRTTMFYSGIVLLRTTKDCSSTTPYYKVLLRYYSVLFSTSRTAQGSGRSFTNWKPIGEVGCCGSRTAEKRHSGFRSPLFLSLSCLFSDYLLTYLSIYVSSYLSTLQNIYLSCYLAI